MQRRQSCGVTTVQFFRLDNPSISDHFYSAGSIEIAEAVSHLGYHIEGVAATVLQAASPAPNTVPFYRAYSGAGGDHFYTIDIDEFEAATSSGGYSAEGVAANVYQTQICGTVPFYRLFNEQEVDHFYTTSEIERDNAVNNLGYQYEGIAAYVNPQ